MSINSIARLFRQKTNTFMFKRININRKKYSRNFELDIAVSLFLKMKENYWRDRVITLLVVILEFIESVHTLNKKKVFENVDDFNWLLEIDNLQYIANKFYQNKTSKYFYINKINNNFWIENNKKLRSLVDFMLSIPMFYFDKPLSKTVYENFSYLVMGINNDFYGLMYQKDYSLCEIKLIDSPEMLSISPFDSLNDIDFIKDKIFNTEVIKRRCYPNNERRSNLYDLIYIYCIGQLKNEDEEKIKNILLRATNSVYYNMLIKNKIIK